MKVLLADDSKTIRTVVQMVFNKRDVDLVVVASGQEALDHAREDRPDVILADMHMEPGNGMWLATKVGTEAGLQGVPVILLTRGNDPPPEARVKESGATASLAKPFTSDDLIALVDEVAVQAPRSKTETDAADAVPVSEPALAAAVDDADDEDDWMEEDDGTAQVAVAPDPAPAPGSTPAQAAAPAADPETEPEPAEAAEPATPPSAPAAIVAAATPPTGDESPLLAALRQAGRVFEAAAASISEAAASSAAPSAPPDANLIRRWVAEAVADLPQPEAPSAPSVSRESSDSAQVKMWIEEALEVAKAEWLEAARRAAREIARQAVEDAAETLRGPLEETARRAAIEAARQATAGGAGTSSDTAMVEKVAWEVIPDLAERVLWELLPDIAGDLIDEVHRRA